MILAIFVLHLGQHVKLKTTCDNVHIGVTVNIHTLLNNIVILSGRKCMNLREKNRLFSLESPHKKEFKASKLQKMVFINIQKFVRS